MLQSISHSASSFTSSPSPAFASCGTIVHKGKAIPSYQFFGASAPHCTKLTALKIVDYLDTKDLFPLSLVNKLWGAVVMDDALWDFSTGKVIKTNESRDAFRNNSKSDNLDDNIHDDDGDDIEVTGKVVAMDEESDEDKEVIQEIDHSYRNSNSGYNSDGMETEMEKE